MQSKQVASTAGMTLEGLFLIWNRIKGANKYKCVSTDKYHDCSMH
jgi:hypothetical protein